MKTLIVLTTALLIGCSAGQILHKHDDGSVTECTQKYVWIPWYAVVAFGVIKPVWESDCKDSPAPVAAK